MKLSIELLERILIVLIFICLSATFILKPDKEVKQEFVINEDSFDIFPLIAWKSTHEKWNGKEGDIVKIKYRVTRSNTKLWIYDVKTDKLVHEQSLIRDPWPDGRHRDFTYVWKLYKTERSQYIPPGEYEIRIGNLYGAGFGNLKTRIKI
tara:strand:+ start:520 stop:969 length:450 start_codon:yes stop_codon:yes gene_type:complete